MQCERCSPEKLSQKIKSGRHNGIIELCDHRARQYLLAALSQASRHVRSGSMLSKKSPQRNCEIRIRNERIQVMEFLNQDCALAPDLESMLPRDPRKILFRQHRSIASRSTLAGRRSTSAMPLKADIVVALRQMTRRAISRRERMQQGSAIRSPRRRGRAASAALRDQALGRQFD
jgi:hypothetical protein